MRVVLRKDRPGHVARFANRGETVMMAELVSHADGSVSYSLTVPTKRSDEADVSELTVAMTRSSAAILTEPGMSKTKVRQAIGGNSALTDRALGALIRDEFVRTESGSRGAVLHFSIKPYPEGGSGDRDPD